MAKQLMFTCPKCGSHSVEEVVDCSQASFLITFMDNEGGVEYADVELDDDAMLDHYHCADCGYALPSIGDIDELREKYMKEV